MEVAVPGKPLSEISSDSLLDGIQYSRQHGFRRCRSTKTVLSRMLWQLEKALRKDAAIALFLDISGAFDNVNITYTSNTP